MSEHTEQAALFEWARAGCRPSWVAYSTLTTALLFCEGSANAEQLRDAGGAALREAALIANKTRGRNDALADATVHGGFSKKKRKHAQNVWHTAARVGKKLELTRAAAHFAYGLLWDDEHEYHKAKLALSDAGLPPLKPLFEDDEA